MKIGTGLRLVVVPGLYAVVRLGADENVPSWPTGARFSSVTRTADELSIVCEDASVPNTVQRNGGWRIVKVQGPLDFSLTGILASLAAPLADAKISIFTVSTFETDYLLVKDADLEGAVKVLTRAGHGFATP